MYFYLDTKFVHENVECYFKYWLTTEVTKTVKHVNAI